MNGIELIARERAEQVSREGWTASHDDRHRCGEMVISAVRYAMHDLPRQKVLRSAANRAWCWGSCWWKPSVDPIRNLTKAGALIAAEIDRLQRLLPAPPRATP